MAKAAKTMDITIADINFNCTAGGWLVLDSYFRELKKVKQPYRGFRKDIANACRDLLLEQLPEPTSKLVTKKQAENAISLLDKPEEAVKTKRSLDYRRWLLLVLGVGYLVLAGIISHHTFLAPNPFPQFSYYGEPIYNTGSESVVSPVPVLDQVMAALLILGLAGIGVVNILAAIRNWGRKRIWRFNSGLILGSIVGFVLLIAVTHAINNTNPYPAMPPPDLSRPFTALDLCGEHVQLVQANVGQESAVFYHLADQGWHLKTVLPQYVNNSSDPLKSAAFCENYYSLRRHYANDHIALNNFHYGPGDVIEPFIWDINTMDQQHFGLFVKD